MNAHSNFALKVGKEILMQNNQYHRYGCPEEYIAVDQKKNVQWI
jgi:hypothetical protein